MRVKVRAHHQIMSEARLRVIQGLSRELGERDQRIAELDGRRREGRMLLHRMVKYVTEDRAQTPGTTRLARLTEKVRDYLDRTHDQKDILR